MTTLTRDEDDLLHTPVPEPLDPDRWSRLAAVHNRPLPGHNEATLTTAIADTRCVWGLGGPGLRDPLPHVVEAALTTAWDAPEHRRTRALLAVRDGADRAAQMIVNPTWHTGRAELDQVVAQVRRHLVTAVAPHPRWGTVQAALAAGLEPGSAGSAADLLTVVSTLTPG